MEMDWHGIGWVARGVLLTLLAMSVLSLGVAVERTWWLRRARRASRQCAQLVSGLLRAGRLDSALDTARTGAREGAHVAPIMVAGLTEWRRLRGTAADVGEAREAAFAAGRAAAGDLSDELRSGLSTLATVASTAPFVGLFGTTFGIMNAFQGIATTGSGGISAISAGISEALVTTAFGLVVAVPALWAHNAFADRAARLEREAERVARELADGLAEGA